MAYSFVFLRLLTENFTGKILDANKAVFLTEKICKTCHNWLSELIIVFVVYGMWMQRAFLLYRQLKFDHNVLLHQNLWLAWQIVSDYWTHVQKSNPTSASTSVSLCMRAFSQQLRNLIFCLDVWIRSRSVSASVGHNRRRKNRRRRHLNLRRMTARNWQTCYPKLQKVALLPQQLMCQVPQVPRTSSLYAFLGVYFRSYKWHNIVFKAWIRLGAKWCRQSVIWLLFHASSFVFS